MTRSGQHDRRTTRLRRKRWAHLSDDKLLDVRLCDLGLRIEGTVLQKRVNRLYEELERHHLPFRPHVWLGGEWFSPDGVPGLAIPFYLAHRRLMKLEKKQMLEVEGGTEAWCMKILRHEAGHAIDTAYRLHWKRRWQHVFGSFAQKYPDYYHPKPYSTRHVLHLGFWYAQAHPAEDFAETFAVWLKPGSRWRQRYKGWPAIRKLECVDEMMAEIADTKPKVRSRAAVEPLSQIRKTLREHYHQRRLHYADEWPDFYDSDLRRLFSDERRFANRQTAAGFLRRIRPELRQVVAEWTGTHPYTIDQVLQDMIDRCRELKLRLARPQHQARHQAMIMVTVQTMNFLHQGHHRVPL